MPQGMSIYSGPGGGVGESVTQADRAPKAHGRLPEIVGTFLGWKYQVSSVAGDEDRQCHRCLAISVPFGERQIVRRRTGVGQTDPIGGLAVPHEISATTEKALSTLTLAS